MTVWKQCGLCLLLLVTLVPRAPAGQIVDRMVANVNGHILLQSDWDEEVDFEAFVDGRSPDSFTAAERKAALDRMIDQELLREQVRGSENERAGSYGRNQNIRFDAHVTSRGLCHRNEIRQLSDLLQQP